MKFWEWIKSLFKRSEPVKEVPRPAPHVELLKPRPDGLGQLPSANFFQEALKYTFRNEGGFSNIKEDKGGATNFGIIREELARWRHHDVTAQDVKDLTRQEAEAIYRAWYWDALKLERITNQNMAVALFDRSVLNGVTGVSRHVRVVLGLGEFSDGDAANFDRHIDEVNLINPVAFVMRLADRCEAKHRQRVEQDHTQKRFLEGWLNRVNRMRRELGDGTEKPIEQWIKDASGHS